MNSKENENLGDEIKQIVQDALNNKNFNELNRDVSNVAKNALDEVRSSINLKINKNNNWTKQSWQSITQNNIQNQSNKYEKIKNELNTSNKLSVKQTKLTVPVGQVSGILLTVFGSIGSIGFGIAIFTLLLLGLALGNFFHTIALIVLPFFVFSTLLLIKGRGDRKRLKRFQKYLFSMRGQNYSLINDLSSSTGLNNKFVERDLRKMISAGMFPEGHIDDEKTTFMLNNESYVQYLELKKNMKLKNLDKIESKEYKALESKKEENIKEKLTPEIRKSIDEGREFVAEIKAANLIIPGEEISLKLDRLEEVTGKIYDYIEKHPEKFLEIKKFTEYFLPTTLKLLQAYKKLDYQTVQGENISSAKKEIEDTINTINLAFENLLDDLFQDMAMDISTDISVLETMLAQEGLTKNNMRVTNKTMEDENE